MEQDSTTRAFLDSEAAGREALREEYGPLLGDITRILQEEDPKGLADVDPIVANEYEGEAGSILARLDSCTSPNDVQQVMFEEFCRWFNGEGGGFDWYRRAAERGWEVWDAHHVR